MEELRRLDQVVKQASARDMHVVLDVHNYAAYRREPIGAANVATDALGDLWRRLADQFQSDPKIIFGLMNEPKGLRTETWLEAANFAIAAIRQTGARNLILVPGNGWSGAHSWMSRGYGTPNAEVMLGVKDPSDNYAYDAHQYLDSDYSGTHPPCRNERIGVTTLEGFTRWLHQHRKRGFLGEFGAGSDPVCLAALDAMLTFMGENRDVWLGWTYWAAGAWPASYFTSVQPVNGEDRPQMSVLLKHVSFSNGRGTR
jgi:endoglucanase